MRRRVDRSYCRLYVCREFRRPGAANIFTKLQPAVSEGESVADLVEDRLVGAVDGADDAVLGDDDRAAVLFRGLDEAVVFQVGQRRLERVDVDVHARPELEDGHPVVLPVGQRVEDRDLRVVAVAVLGFGPHGRLFGVMGLTCIPRLDRCGGGLGEGSRPAGPPECSAFGQTARLCFGGDEHVVMSIKCSLLGHSFDETTVERERSEEGTEVVITITEMETCSRCGETRVVSENKEVTTLEVPADEETASPGTDDADGGDDTDEFATTPTDDAEEDDETVESTGGTDAVILDDDGGAEASAQAEARGAEPTIPDAEGDVSAASDTDGEDAVIIGDAEGGDRDPGEWPDEDEEAAADESEDGGPDADADGEVEGDADVESDAADDRDPGEWPDEPADPAERAGESDEVEILGGGDADETPSDAPVESDDADEDGPGPAAAQSGAASDHSAQAGAGDDGTADADSGRSKGEWPETETPTIGSDAVGDWPDETKRDEPADSGISGPSLDGEDGPSVSVPEGMFKCSECGFTTEADSSSLRAGDFCPECHRGTLLQREDEAAAEE